MANGRLPIESSQPIVAFAAVRVAFAVAALAALVVTGFPFEGALTLVIAGGALPWSIAIFLLARRNPTASISPWVAAGDLGLLALAQAVAPDLYAAVRFSALFLIAAHAQFVGERLAVGLAAAFVAVLIAVDSFAEGPIDDDLLVLYESVFAVAALASAVVVSRLITSESAGRLRARELTRRQMEAEARVRRSLANTIHDGPVQELVALDMMLASAEQAVGHGDYERWRETISEARILAERNAQALRDEIVSLGPIAFDELSLPEAIENCAPVWRRRWGLNVKLELDSLDLPNDVCGGLFGITQEAVSNVGRHASAEGVRVTLARRNGRVMLEVADDGKGFGNVDPESTVQPGHIGLASMRERAVLLEGDFEIESGDQGTTVRVLVPA